MGSGEGKEELRLDWIGLNCIVIEIGFRFDWIGIGLRLDFIEIESVESVEAEGQLRWVLVRGRRRTGADAMK